MEIVTKEMFEAFVKETKEQLNGITSSITNTKVPKYLKNKEVMDLIGCSYSTLCKLRSNNLLPYKMVMGTYYYDLKDINSVFSNTR